MAINYELINKGGISLGTNFELLGEKPLDARLVVPSLGGLAHLIAEKAAYAGMIVYVTSESKHYQVNADGSYRQFGLTTEEINDIITDATTAAMEFKGATATLPESGVKGDMYKVSASFEVAAENDAQGVGFTTKIGDSVVFDGEKWYLIPSGDDIEDTWRPVTDVDNDATLTFVDGDKIDAVVAADGTVKFNHEKLEAAPSDIATEEDKKTRTYLTAVEVDEYGHVTNYKTATENVEDTDTTYDFECQVEHSNVHFSVKASNADQAEEICVDAYTRNEVDGKVDTKLDASGWVMSENGTLAYDKREEHEDDSEEFISINQGKITLGANFGSSNDITAFGIELQDLGYAKLDSLGLELGDDVSNGNIKYTASGIELYGVDTEDGETAKVAFPEKGGVIALTSDIDTAVEALEDKIDSIDYSSFKTKQDEYSVTGDVKKTVTGVTQNANGEVEVTFGDIDFSHNHDDQYKKLQEQVEFYVEDTNTFITDIIQNENGEIITAATRSVDFTEVNEAIDKKLDAGNWINTDDKLTIFNQETSSDAELSIDHLSIYDGRDFSSTYITPSSVSLMVAGDTSTTYTVGSIKNSFEDSIGENSYDATLLLPKKSGTFALTSDVDTALQAAKDYADAKSHENTTYEFAATENALEFTVTPSEGEAQTVTLVAPTVDTGVMEVTAGTDIVVTPGENGTVEVAHKEYQTGTVKDASHDSTTDPSFITGITIENGHVTGATVQNLAAILANMEFILDGGKSTT